jgi:hypothetical protein
MELQTAFYIIGIVFMSLMLVLLIALVVAVFVIRAKIISIHDQIEDKLNTVGAIATASSEIIGRVKKVVSHKLR